MRWLRLSSLLVASLGGLGCQGAPVTPLPPRPAWPESCGVDAQRLPVLRARLGRPRLRLIGPTGAAGEARDCRGPPLEITGRMTAVSGEGARASYEAELLLPGHLPAGRTEWVVVPPLVVTADGVVTRHSYQPGLYPDRYRSATSGGAVGPSPAPLRRLTLDAAADEDPPQLLRVEAGMGLVEQGGHITLSAAVSDGGSGLPTPSPERPEALPQVALFGLLSRETGFQLPLFPLTAPTQSVEALVPGQVPAGVYEVYGEAQDAAGNRVRWEAAPGVPLTEARYQAQPAPRCILPRLMPFPAATGVPLATVIVGSVPGVDRRPPQLLGLGVEGETREGPLVAGACQELRLRVDLSDDRAMPPFQQAWFWVGPLGGDGLAALTEVPAQPGRSAGQLEARFVVPAEAAAGPWIFLPAQAQDAAGNVLLGAHEPAAGGPGAIRTGDLLSPPGPDPLDPRIYRGERQAVGPGRFCVRSCEPGGGAPGPAAVLEQVEVLDVDANAPVRAGRTLRLRFTFRRQAGGLPTTL